MLIKKLIYRIKFFFLERYILFRGGKLFFGPAIRKAKRLHKETDLRYRVFFFKGKYYVWNRTEVRRQMNNGFLARVKLEADLDKVCFFDTQKNT